MLNVNNKKEGFSIIELIIAGAISITTLGIGFSLLQIALKGNKLDETQMGINGRINDTLDFILDEVKASKRIIDSEIEITNSNSSCTYPVDDEFLFGISIPDQALVKGDYEPKGDGFNLNQIECPIVYSLRENLNNENSQYSLIRYGPQYNEIGYYISPSFSQFQETKLLEGITSSTQYKKINCPFGWGDIKTVKGISFCIDEYKKAIEIQIEAGDSQLGIQPKEIRSIASVGGFSSIQDEALINFNSIKEDNINGNALCLGGQCCWLGICLTSNKVTYIIDNSYFMDESYLHYNGMIVNGNWQPENNPKFISPRINGKNLLDFIISNLKQHLNKLPSSKSSSEEDKFYIQIIANNGTSNYLFEDGPQELTSENKIIALSFLDNLKAEVESAINPWNDICKSLESEYVGQVIILSAWKPSTTEASRSQPCVGIENGKFSEIVNEYNLSTRSKSATGALSIETISLFHNYCSTRKNIFKNNWMGSISEGSESNCIHIK